MKQSIFVNEPRTAPSSRRPPEERISAPPPRLKRPSESYLLKQLVLLFIVSLFIPEQAYATVGSLKVTATFAVSIFLFPSLMVWGKIRWIWPDLLVLLVFILYFTSTLRAAPLEAALQTQGRLLLGGLTPYLVGRYVMQEPQRMQKFMAIIVTAIAIFAVASLLESFARFNIHSALWGYEYLPHKEKRLGLTRAHGVTTHAIMFGLVNAIFFPVVAVAVLEKRKDIVGRFPLLKGSVSPAGHFSVAVDRGVDTVGFDRGLRHLGLLVARRQVIPLAPDLSSSSLPAISFLEYASGRPLLRIAMMKFHLSSEEAWFYRWELYHRVYEAMPGYWWFGHGEEIPFEFHQQIGWSIDNNFLVVLLKYGRIGLVAWVGLSLAVLIYGGKAVWASHNSVMVRVARALGFAVIGVCVTQFSVALFSLASLLFWMVLGLTLGAAINCKKEVSVLRQAKLRGQKPGKAPPAGREPGRLRTSTLR